MARETVTQSKRFFCVSLSPDVCLTPVGSNLAPLPYPVKAEFKDAQSVSRDVKHQGEPAFLAGKSVIPKVSGDSRGVKGGVKSGTHQGKVEPKDKSGTGASNGRDWLREADVVWMNAQNTVGRIYERGSAAAKARAKELAQDYRDSGASEALHEFSDEAMEVGGTVATAGGATALVGGGVALTGVGAPAGGVIATAGGAISAVGGGVSAAGAATGAGADVLDAATEWILDDKAPSLSTLAMQQAERGAGWALRRIPGGRKAMERLFPKKPAAKPKPAPAPAPAPAKRDGQDGGKTQQAKPEQKRQPKECCPQNQGPGGAATRSRRPIHFGTGDELLVETDLEVEGPLSVIWSRTYRSSNAAYDRGLFGARWISPYTVRLSLGRGGMVYHDPMGRVVLLPLLNEGDTYDEVFEGFVIRRLSSTRFDIEWRDGAVDRFDVPRCEALARDELPLGISGLAPLSDRLLTRPARRNESVTCLYLTQQRQADGRTLDLQWLPEWTAEQLPQRLDERFVVLRLTGPSGLCIEAHAAPTGELSERQRRTHGALRIGSLVRRVPLDAGADRPVTGVDRHEAWEVVSRYAYGREDATVESANEEPIGIDLLGQKDAVGRLRRYHYLAHLLVRYADPTGAAWILRWQGPESLFSSDDSAPPPLSDKAPPHVGRLEALTSHWARAIFAMAEDGAEPLHVRYVDERTTQVRQADGSLWTYLFGPNHLCVDIRVQDAQGGTPVRLGRRRWSEAGDLVEETDAAGRTIRYVYDARGQLLTTVDPAGGRTTIEYDDKHRAVRSIDALGHVRSRSFDDAGRVVAQVDPLGRTTRFAYDVAGQLTEVMDAADRVKRIAYDDHGRMIRYTDCSGNVTQYEWTSRGRPLAQVDALGQATRYEWNDLNQLAAIHLPDGSKECFEYDLLNRMVRHVDGAGQSTRYRYQAQGLPVERIDALGNRLRYRYDRALRLIELVNGNGDACRFEYDGTGRLVKEIGFDGQVCSREYDEAGDVRAMQRGSQRIDYTRDLMGRVVAIASADDQTHFAWDPLGRLIATANAFTQTRFRWDAAGQLVEERQRVELAGPAAIGPSSAATDSPAPTVDSPNDRKGPAAAFKISHEYDALGQRVSTRLPNGRRVQVQRFGPGHWHGVLWQGRPLADVERDPLHREARRSFGGEASSRTSGTIRTLRYDRASRVEQSQLSVTEAGVIEILQRRDHVYSLTGRLTQIRDSLQGDVHYQHDAVGQLLAASQPGLAEIFSFDPAGNMVPLPPRREHDSAVPARRPLSDDVDRGPRMAPVLRNLLTQALNWRYQHDADGATVRKRWVEVEPANETLQVAETDNLRLVYDAEQRLVQVDRLVGSSIQSSFYRYDALGRRVSKRVVEEDDERLTVFVWDGDRMIQEIDRQRTVNYVYEPDSVIPLALVTCEATLKDHLDETVAIAPIAAWDVPQPPDHPPDAHVRLRERLARWAAANDAEQLDKSRRDESAVRDGPSDQVLFYHCDHLGTPLALIDGKGRTAWRARYRAWGRIERSDVEIASQPLRFQGQYEDAETGLYYNRHRYYDPDVGRYVTPDPIRLLGGLNLNAYVPDPTAWVDPLGLAPRKPADQSKIDRDCRGRFRDQHGRYAKDPGWPPDRGFLDGKADPVTLTPGTLIDRYGHPYGTFVSPMGEPFTGRALPASYQTKEYHVYEVLKPITAQGGKAAPWFKQPGMATQYELPDKVIDLIKSGHLREVTPCPIS